MNQSSPHFLITNLVIENCDGGSLVDHILCPLTDSATC